MLFVPNAGVAACVSLAIWFWKIFLVFVERIRKVSFIRFLMVVVCLVSKFLP